MKLTLCCLFLIISLQLHSQETVIVQGFVNDSLNKPVEMASVMIQKKGKANVIVFVYTNQKGLYKLSFKPDSSQYILSVSALNFERNISPILTNQAIVTQDIILRSKEVVLNEVIVKGKSPAIKLGEDSTVYKASRFLDGSEKSVEDLLKKLPGIQVAESGKVYFKGKLVEKVYLDGDDLLGSNYTMATRNIDAKLINEVQALENFSTNILLKGIEKSDKTVLNLSIYEEKKRFAFGNVEMAHGNQDFKKFNLSLFSYLKKIKLYTIASHNNVGTQNNPEGDELPELDKLLEDNNNKITQNQPIIGIENLYSPNLKKERINFNDETLASINSIYSITKQLKVKTNLAFYKDSNKQTLLLDNTYRFNNNSFRIEEVNQQLKRPQVGTIKIEAEYFLKQNSKLKYSIWGQRMTNTVQHDLLFKSDTSKENIAESVQNKFSFFNQSLNYTYRYPNKKALTIDVNHHVSSLPQNYVINTDGIRYADFFGLNSHYQSVKQVINNPLNEVNIGIKLFGLKNKYKYYFQTGLNLSHQQLNTSLSLSGMGDDTLVSPSGYQNSVSFNKNVFFAKAGLTQVIGKLSLSSNLGLHYLAFHINQEEESKNNTFYLEPNASFLYRFNLITAFRGAYQYSQDFSNINDIASNYWLQGFRSLSSGYPKIVKTNLQTYSATISHLDNYNQFTLISGLYYFKKNNVLGSVYILSNEFDVSTKSIIPHNDLVSYSFLTSKYLPVISSQVKFETNISWNSFTNYINNGNERKNLLTNSIYKFTYVTTLNGKFNFSMGATLQNNAFKSVTSDIVNEGNNEWWNSFLNIRFKTKQFFLSLNNERFWLNKQVYNFVDATARYNFKNNKISLEINVNNLLNTKTFQQIFLSDYTTNKLEYAIMPRFVLLGINYRF